MLCLFGLIHPTPLQDFHLIKFAQCHFSYGAQNWSNHDLWVIFNYIVFVGSSHREGRMTASQSCQLDEFPVWLCDSYLHLFGFRIIRRWQSATRGRQSIVSVSFWRHESRAEASLSFGFGQYTKCWICLHLDGLPLKHEIDILVEVLLLFGPAWLNSP